MAKLTAEMTEFFKGKTAYVASIGTDGVPNVGPRGSFRVIDDEHVVWTEGTFKETYENLQKNPGVALAIVERETRKGCRLRGMTELLTDGPNYEKVKKEMQAIGRQDLIIAASVSVKEIYDIGIPTWQKLA